MTLSQSSFFFCNDASCKQLQTDLLLCYNKELLNTNVQQSRIRLEEFFTPAVLRSSQTEMIVSLRGGKYQRDSVSDHLHVLNSQETMSCFTFSVNSTQSQLFWRYWAKQPVMVELHVLWWNRWENNECQHRWVSPRILQTAQQADKALLHKSKILPSFTKCLVMEVSEASWSVNSQSSSLKPKWIGWSFWCQKFTCLSSDCFPRTLLFFKDSVPRQSARQLIDSLTTDTKYQVNPRKPDF